MSNPIKSIIPYKVKGIKCIDDYFFILRRLSKLIENNKFRIDPDGILVLIRWSHKKNCWVGDRCTSLSRDKYGISKEDLPYLSKLNKDYKFVLNILLDYLSERMYLIDRYNLQKNENKILAFKVNIKDYITKDICAKVIGLYNINRSKPCNVLDITNETIISISRDLNLSTEHVINDNCRNSLFEDFLKSIKNHELILNVNNSNKKFYLKNIISANQKIFENKISLDNKKYDNFNSTLFREIIYNNKNIDELVYENILPNITLFYINTLYFEFLKCTINLDDNISTLNIYDKFNKKLYKLSDCNYINKENDSGVEKSVDVTDNNSLDFRVMLPGLI